MLLNISHVTRYTYDQPVVYALQKVRLRPLTNPLLDVEDWDIRIEGGRIEASYRDHFGNHVDLVSAEPGTHHMTLTAEGTARINDNAGILGHVHEPAPLWLFKQSTDMTRPGKGVAELARAIEHPKSELDGLHDLSAAILARVPYQIGKTEADTTAEDAVAIGHGVCQDHTNIFVAAARKAGLPARYVSGYLYMPDREDQDASHAWAEVYLKDLGWVGFDASNGVSPDEKYLRIAVGRDSREAAPISGLRLGTGNEAMIVSLQVQQ